MSGAYIHKILPYVTSFFMTGLSSACYERQNAWHVFIPFYCFLSWNYFRTWGSTKPITAASIYVCSCSITIQHSNFVSSASRWNFYEFHKLNLKIVVTAEWLIHHAIISFRSIVEQLRQIWSHVSLILINFTVLCVSHNNQPFLIKRKKLRL